MKKKATEMVCILDRSGSMYKKERIPSEALIRCWRSKKGAWGGVHYDSTFQ